MSFFTSIALAFLAATPSGQLAFVSFASGGDQRVCVLDVATGSIQRVGPGNADGAPVWSPDGEWLAFDAATDDGRAIWLVKADGSDLHPLRHAAKHNAAPRWLPDGKALVYAAGDGLEQKVVVYDLGTEKESVWGGEQLNFIGLTRPVWLDLAGLVKSGKEEFREALLGVLGDSWKQQPAFVAIGLYKGEKSVSTELCLVAPNAVLSLSSALDSGGLSRSKPGSKSTDGGYDHVEWFAEPGPSGEVIAFESNDGGDREIFVLSLKKGITDLSNHAAADWDPVWSPNGKWLAFESFRSGRRGIYRAYPGTVRVFPVSVSANADNWAPAWLPDGQWLVFVSDRTGTPQLYLTDVVGDHVHSLTKGSDAAYAPAWRPGSGK